MSSNRKKVILRKLNREWISGYLPTTDFIEQGGLGLLDLDGKVTPVRLAEVKWICFVRDFHSGDTEFPERLLSKTFTRRPRTQGLWLRATLKDNDIIEGLAQNDASILDTNGLLIVPPDSRSNTQRIFLPRSAIKQLEILAVVRTASQKKPSEAIQESLFTPQSGTF
jgi:Family of unknown function (DUF6982)